MYDINLGGGSHERVSVLSHGSHQLLHRTIPGKLYWSTCRATSLNLINYDWNKSSDTSMTHQLNHNLFAVIFMLSETAKKRPLKILQHSFSQYKMVRKRMTLILISIKFNSIRRKKDSQQQYEIITFLFWI